MSDPTTPKRPGDLVDCRLCGGDGYVSHETASTYGRPAGDSTCPSCDGRGRVPYRPLPPNPSADPRPDDWTCKRGHRCRRRWLYCPCGAPNPDPNARGGSPEGTDAPPSTPDNRPAPG